MLFRTLKRVAHRLWGRDKKYYVAFRSIFGVTPDNIELYKVACIHRSVSVCLEDRIPINNERLEFLGDAVLESIVSDYLFIEFPDRAEGFLTQVRSKIVSRQTLNEVACKIGLDKLVAVNYAGSYTHRNIFGNALEAIIGAIYLDKGYDVINRIIINHIFSQHIDLKTISNTERDFKSRLIEWCQKSRKVVVFNTKADNLPDDVTPHFISQITIDGIEFGNGSGLSKKEAEQSASCVVWQLLNDDKFECS